MNTTWILPIIIWISAISAIIATSIGIGTGIRARDIVRKSPPKSAAHNLIVEGYVLDSAISCPNGTKSWTMEIPIPLEAECKCPEHSRPGSCTNNELQAGCDSLEPTIAYIPIGLPTSQKLCYRTDPKPMVNYSSNGHAVVIADSIYESPNNYVCSTGFVPCSVQYCIRETRECNQRLGDTGTFVFGTMTVPEIAEYGTSDDIVFDESFTPEEVFDIYPAVDPRDGSQIGEPYMKALRRTLYPISVISSKSSEIVTDGTEKASFHLLAPPAGQGVILMLLSMFLMLFGAIITAMIPLGLVLIYTWAGLMTMLFLNISTVTDLDEYDSAVWYLHMSQLWFVITWAIFGAISMMLALHYWNVKTLWVWST